MFAVEVSSDTVEAIGWVGTVAYLVRDLAVVGEPGQCCRGTEADLALVVELDRRSRSRMQCLDPLMET